MNARTGHRSQPTAHCPLLTDMPSANVQLDAIRDFRVQLVKFIETTGVCLADADADILRTLGWLETEMVPYWASQIRKREELVMRCKEAVRQKTLYKDATGRPQSAIDEQKALKKAQLALEEAQSKFTASKQYIRQIQKQQHDYKGQVQKLALNVAGNVTEQVSKLQALYNIVAQYGTNDGPMEQRSMAQREGQGIRGEGQAEDANANDNSS